MKRLSVILTVLLLATAQAKAQPSLPSTISASPGRLTTLVISTGGVKCKWRIVPETVDVFREYTPDSENITLKIIGKTEGTAYLLVWSAKDSLPSDASLCVITIGETPAPTPTPGPTDELTKSFQSAFDSEIDSKRREKLDFLQAFYAGAKSLLTGYYSYADLLRMVTERMHDPVNGIPKGSLPILQKAIVSEWSKALGDDFTQPIDVRKCETLFARISKALSGVKR